MNILTLILSVIVSAQLDSAQLMIGDQCNLLLQTTLSEDESVQFPVYSNTIIDGIEIVKRTTIDTVNLKDGNKQLSQTFTITSFKDSLFLIPPIGFIYNNDTLYSEALVLNVVQPFEIDTTNAITDIKDVYNSPIWWWGIIRWLLLIVVIVALMVGITGLIIYIDKSKKKKTGELVLKVPKRPAEEIAKEKLDIIKQEKVWQKGRQKEYYTSLTDTVREYIANRFEISSQEQTSKEILSSIQPLLKEQKELFSMLQNLLNLADLVKFAKWTALPDENEQSLLDAYEFVAKTTVPQTDETDNKEDSEN